MKKLLALTVLAATVAALTACGPDTGKPPSGPPALIQPVAETPAAPSRLLGKVNNNELYEITGTNSNGTRFRCYITDGPSSVSQTCFEYGPAK